MASHDDDEDDGLPPLPKGTRNYITPRGADRLRDEIRHLMTVERPKVVEIVSWAAGNGDRSENGDYIYGKKRLREIDPPGPLLAQAAGVRRDRRPPSARPAAIRYSSAPPSPTPTKTTARPR